MTETAKAGYELDVCRVWDDIDKRMGLGAEIGMCVGLELSFINFIKKIVVRLVRKSAVAGRARRGGRGWCGIVVIAIKIGVGDGCVKGVRSAVMFGKICLTSGKTRTRMCWDIRETVKYM